MKARPKKEIEKEVEDAINDALNHEKNLQNDQNEEPVTFVKKEKNGN